MLISALTATLALVAVSDADMAPTAYVNGRLDPRVPGASDQLLAIDPRSGRVEATRASNAVNGPAAAVDKSADGRYAVVVETTRPARPGATLMSELEPGREVSLHRLGRRPVTVDRTVVPDEPTAAAISPDGRHVLVTTRDRERPLVVLELTRGRFGDRQTPTMPPFPATGAVWSPDGKRVAVVAEESNTVALYRFGERGLRAIGEPVIVADRAFGGVFAPDGRTFVVNSLPRLALPAPGTPVDPAAFLGTLTVIDVAGAPRIRQTVATPIGPEGLTVSPDGRWLVTANYQTTPLEPGHPLFSPTASLSLWTLDAQGLTKVSDTPFDGILPEGVDFDPSGRRLAVATYQRDWGGLASEGSVDLWRLDPARPALTLERRVPAPRGVHSLAWR